MVDKFRERDTLEPMSRITRCLAALMLFFAPLMAQSADSLIVESITGLVSGPVSQILEFYRDGRDVLTLKRSILFDRHGRAVAERNYGEDGELLGETRISYTRKGLVSAIHGTDSSDRVTWKYTYAYDEANALIEESAFDSEGRLEGRLAYTRDRNGRVSRRTQYGAAGEVSLEDAFQYDERGLLVARVTLYSDGKLLKRVLRYYDASSRLTVEERYDANGLYEREDYAYDERGHLSHIKTFNAKNELKKRIKRSCGTDGRILEETVFDAGGRTRSRTEYQYDERGNWVSKHEVDSGFLFREYIYKE